uniref:Methyl-accepting transducer domain-containing protein n=1 Tax=Elaeophora elaphi TaxID=1147741 RepID=A0A158Q8V1_9BILA
MEIAKAAKGSFFGQILPAVLHNLSKSKENIMDREFESEEPHSGILSKAEEFAEFAIEKASDVVKASEAKVMDATNKAMNGAKVAGEGLGDTIHLFGDKLKETAGQAADKGHQTLETAKDTASNVLSGIAQDVSSVSQKTLNVAADVTHSLDEDANKAMHTFKEEFDDATRDILETTHSALKNTLQEEGMTASVLKGAAAQAIHSAEDVLTDLNDKVKDSDLYARAEASGTTEREDLIRLTEEINRASQHDAKRPTMFDQPADGIHQDIDDPSQQWGLDWRQYSNEAAGIDGHHAGFDPDVKTVHSADDSSAEESMFDRKGPLTIPHHQVNLFCIQYGFEVSPRPPTPPKELDDEDVKPTTIDLGQTTSRSCEFSHSFISEHPNSILKNSTQGVRFNFKNMDARCKLSCYDLRDFIVYWTYRS